MTGVHAAVAIDLDRALVDTRPLWQDWLDSAAAVLGADARALPADRADAAAELDLHGPGNWLALLERYCEDRVAVYVRRDAETSDALRSLAAAGWEIGAFTDAPEPLARVALAQIGADRRIGMLAAGAGALELLRASLGEDVLVVSSPQELMAAADAARSSGRDS